MPNIKNKTKFIGSSISKNSGWLEKYGDGGKKLDTSNWKQSSIDSLNLYNQGNEMVKWAKKNPNFTAIEHNKKDIELNIKYPVSSMALGNIDAKNWADINSTKSGNYGVPLYDKPVGVQKKLIKPKVKPKLDTSNWEQSSLDSLKLYNKWNVPLKPGEAKRPLTQEEKKFYKDEKTGISPISMTYKISSPNVWGYAGNFQKPVGVQKKKVEPVKELVKTETVNLTEPIKTQSINILNPIDENRREVNFGQKYQTFNYPGQHGYSGNDVTSKYFDPTTKNEIDVSKSFDLKGNYNPVYLEQKKYGGWLEQYGDGGETDQNPLLKSKTLLLEGNDENPQDLGPDANRSGFGINDKKIHISDNRKIRATTGKKINPNVALKTGDYDENVIDSLIKYSIKYNIDPNRVLAQGLAESAFGKEDSQNIGHLKNFYRNESPYPQMMEAILEGDSFAKTKKNKKTTREEIIQGYNKYGKLFPETEKDYHGGNSKGFYEVPFGKEGYLDMDKNPLYGIEIKDLMDNVIGKDAQIQYKILKSKNPIKKEFYNPNNVKIPYRRKNFKYGGWLDTYEDGGETDPPVNLRSASTQLASPVSTQAPEVPLNKTGWDWVKQKYENRQPSEWNMLMMDKSGSYVDSGVDPFSLMLTAPQQVIKAGVKGGKALLDASKNNKIKQIEVPKELPGSSNKFKSEIDWSKWNKEIPDNTQLMKEYNTIEQTSKANGTWMKNPDGSKFEGTPEQFVQQNSENFKKAFPEGFDKTYRGVSNFFNTNKLNEPLFTGDISNAKHYASANNPGFWNVNKNIIKEASKFTDPIPQSLEHLNMVREASKTGDWSKVRAIEYNDVLNSNAGGVHSFYSPKSKNSITIDAKSKEWTNIPYEGREMPTDFVAEDLFNKNLDYININNVRDPRIGDLKIINPNRINAKSARGNNGMFDMTNPNIYKAAIPIGLGVAASQNKQDNSQWLDKYK